MSRRLQYRRGTALRGMISGLAALALGMTTVGATTLGAGATAGAPGSTASSPTNGGPTPSGAPQTTSVTLVTGDTVRLTTVDGRRSATIDPGPDRDAVDIHQMEIDGDLYVMPLDVIAYLGAGLLDRDLFNVDSLIEQGYDDASTDALPLIATYDDGVQAAEAMTFESAEAEPLDSIAAEALSVQKDAADQFWAEVTAGEAANLDDEPLDTDADTDTEPALAGAVSKLWLDGRIQVDLHESTGQVGAPAAWDVGIDGEGATVAVLDSGVDADHPDLTGKVVAEKNFATGDSPNDGHGHGSHVASTMAGSGAASDGLRKGVAPGADVISGKVLDDAGSGSESDIIAGMEWAAESGADVVNLSLGGGPTDGTDPMSLAVDALTAEHDVLFVVSAGNDGPGASTISSPGSADSALTVGAVDRDDAMADFSSRGPRIGDLAIKPDITAPGVGIVAARADGTSMGSPVDPYYTAANGTSMAAPHVAGAAALLATQHPDWTPQQLKDALVSTADLGDSSAYDQGGGRVDIANVITGDVTASGSVTLGSFADGDTGTVTEEVTWTNTGDAAVTLTLDLALQELGGDPTGDAVTLGSDTVTVPAGGTASVPVTVDVGALPSGEHTGWLTATVGGDVIAHTTMGVVKQPPVHTVSIDSISRDGEDASAIPVAIFGTNPRYDVIKRDSRGETLEVELAEGTYFLHAMIGGDGHASVVVDPNFEVTGDRDVILDAREANQVEIETPQPSEVRGNLGFITHREIGTRAITNSTMKLDNTREVYVTPTEPVDDGYFEFTSRWQLAAPMLRAQEPGPGGTGGLDLWPNYERYSPEMPVDDALPVVDVGRGLPEDYEGRDVADKVVVVHPNDKGWTQSAADAAAEAGAAMMLIAPLEGTSWPVTFTGRGARLPVPVAVLSHEEADQVAERLDQGELNLGFTGSQEVPYRYDVVQVSPGHVPERVVHTVTEENTATITANYHEMGGEEWSKEQRFAWRPWQDTTIVETQHELRTPQTRTEYVSTGDTLWRQHVLHFFSWDSLNPIRDGAIHDIRTYADGEQVTYDWYRGVQRPAVVGDGAVREAHFLTLPVAEFVQGAAETYARGSLSEVSAQVLEDGEVIGEGDALWGTYTASKESARYQVDLTTDRTGADWEYGTHTETTWEFDSQRPAEGEQAALPMMRVDYDVPVETDNRVQTEGSFHEMQFTVAHPGVSTPPEVASLRAWASFDEGARWQPLDVRRSGDGVTFDARVRHRAAPGTVSLKVAATDDDGNTMTQTVHRAYGID